MANEKFLLSEKGISQIIAYSLINALKFEIGANTYEDLFERIEAKILKHLKQNPESFEDDFFVNPKKLEFIII